MTAQNKIVPKWVSSSLLLASVPIAIVALSTLTLAGFDPTILKTISQHMNVSTILFGALLPSAWTVGLVGLVVYVSYLVENNQKFYRENHLELVFVNINIVLFFAALSPMIYAAAVLVALTLPEVLLRAKRHITATSEAKDKDSVAPGGFIMSISLSLMLLVTTLSSGWLPYEQIETSNKIYHGYVLGIQESWVSILTPEKAVIMVKSDLVNSRTICHQDQPLYQSLVMTIQKSVGSSHKEVPQCQDPRDAIGLKP